MSNQEFLKSLYAGLKKEMQCKWRVQSFSKNKPQATLISYIDARECMDVLDEHAIYGWQREHYMVDGKVYCKVGITFPDGSIQWRSDCGVESNTEKEKGESSDSFKRACVNWGIGRFLYDMPVKYLPASEKKTQSNNPYVVDENGKQVYDITEYVNRQGNKSNQSNQTKTSNESSKQEEHPWMTETEFNGWLPRVKKGEPGLWDKIKSSRRIKKEWKEAFEKSVSEFEVLNPVVMNVVIGAVKGAKTIQELTELFNRNPEYHTVKEFTDAFAESKKRLAIPA